MRFINSIVLSINDKTLRVYTKTRKFPFQYHYDTNTWQLDEGDTGENLTKSVLKYCDADSMDEVVRDYTYKHYMHIFQSQLKSIDSKAAINTFCNTENFQCEISDTLIEPVMDTIEKLKEFTDTSELKEEVDRALVNLYGKGSEQIIKTAISDYSDDSIDYEFLSKTFYEYIDNIKRYDAKLAERLDKQMDILYRQSEKNKNH